MNQIKIGGFLKELRNEKHMTQEELAEHFNVTRRTVSRWETGNNLPDLDVLLEMSDFYQVDLRELLNGERKSNKMNDEEKETVRNVIELSNDQREKIKKRMHILFIIGLIIGLVEMFLVMNDLAESFLGGFCQGSMLGYIIIGCIMTSKHASKIQNMKMKIIKKG